MTKARDLSKLLSTSNGKIAGENLDVSFENITDTGTEGTKVASGTSAERGSTAGQLRFNTETGVAEYYTGTAFKAIDSPPVVSSLDVTEVDSQAGGNQTIVITGSSFASGATVTFVGNSGTDFDASTVTVDSETQITAVAPKASFLNAQEPYGVKVLNTSGLSATLSSQINVDSSPTWTTASGSLGEVMETFSGSFSATATDPDGDTVAYSETTSVLSGAGFSLNSSTGAITGTPSEVSSDTTNTFTLRATANGKTADRQFSIITKNESYNFTNLKVYVADNCSDQGSINGTGYGGDTSVTTDMGSQKYIRGYFAYTTTPAVRDGTVTVYGSNDNSSFTQLFSGTQTGNACGYIYVGQSRTLATVKNSFYRYVRVDFGSSSGHHPRIARFGVETLDV